MVSYNRNLNTSRQGEIYAGYDASKTGQQHYDNGYSNFGNTYDHGEVGSKSNNNNKNGYTCRGLLMSLVQLAALMGISYYAYDTSSVLETKLSELSDLNKMYISLHKSLEEKQTKLEEVRSSISGIKAMVDSPEFEHFWSGELSVTEKLDNLIERHDTQEERITGMQHGLQEMNHMELEMRFGKGPYEVEFQILFQGTNHWFTVETVSNNEQPHSVYTFMDAIDNKAWDGSSFVYAPSNKQILMITAEDDENGRPNNSHLANSLTFPEYSKASPHEKYTLGFGGRPGGPNFYINLDDNTRIHGPGGQKKHARMEEADSCFAKIIHGMSLIDEINELVGDETMFWTIVNAKIV